MTVTKKNKMLNFCTLFDLNFITQGLAMYESLKRVCPNFHLYIFAFCDENYKLLKKLNLQHVTVISLKDFEDQELLKIKPARTAGEYCWTCSSSTILYCLQKYNLDSCTYLDADLYFYSSPQVLIDEMGDKSVLITEHRYTPKYDQTKTSGKYCVQFVTFKNNATGLKVLKWWRNACLEWCYNRCEDGKFGDQKYLDDWTTRFSCVHVLQNLGGGIAPWNIQQYKIKKEDNDFYVLDRHTKQWQKIVFYHFHEIKILANGKVDKSKIKYYHLDHQWKKYFFNSYLNALIKISYHLHDFNKNVITIRKR